MTVATRSEIESSQAAFFRNRLFNGNAFAFRHLMDSTPEQLVPEMNQLTDTMALKITMKDRLTRENHSFDDLKSDPDLLSLEKSSGTELSAFDFVDFKLDALCRLLQDWGCVYADIGPYDLSARHQRRFLFQIEKLKALFEDTRLAYDFFDS